MFDNVLPVESAPISVVSSRWLWAARCFALFCTTALDVGFVVEAEADDIRVALIFFGRWGSSSLALLYLLFCREKNSLAFALGMGAATAFIALLPVESMLSRSPFSMMSEFSPQLATLGALLLWLFSISLAMLGLSSIVAFQKMAHEAKGGETAIGFRAGRCCALVVWMIFMLIGLFFGGFRI